MITKAVESCFNGEVVIRCYAASWPHDVKLAISNLRKIADSIFEGGGDETDYSVNRDESKEESAVTKEKDDWHDEDFAEPINVRTEYEGGKNMDSDEDERMDH